MFYRRSRGRCRRRQSIKANIEEQSLMLICKNFRLFVFIQVLYLIKDSSLKVFDFETF